MFQERKITMFNLYDYEFKNIRLTDIDGKVWEGKSDAVTSANDNDDTEENPNQSFG